MMRKAILLVAVACVCLLTVPGQASAYLQDWYFNPNGNGMGQPDTVLISNLWDITGRTAIFNDLQHGTFAESGLFYSQGHDSVPWGSGLNQITGVLTAGGTVTPDLFTFTSGQLELYSDSNHNYGSNDAIYGANDGTKIGTFTLTSGTGALQHYDPLNGEITTYFMATELAYGYFFDSNGYDLANYNGQTSPFVLGIATVNASIVAPNQTQIDEWNEWIGLPGGGNYTNNFPNYFFVSNDGQFRLDVVPEPASLLLLGSGLLGLAGFRRRKKR